jgi:hypothetical protein
MRSTKGKNVLCQEMIRRGGVVVRAAFDHHFAGPGSQHQRRKNRLKNERAAARRSDRKAVLAGPNLARRKRERGRPERGAVDLCAAHFGRGQDRRQMLAEQSRLCAARTDVVDAEGLPRHQGKA